MLQGNYRLERGILYFNYIQQLFGSTLTGRHSKRIIADVGHDFVAVYDSADGKGALFDFAAPPVPEGAILVVDRDASGGAGALVRIDPATGIQTILSEAGLFSDPSDVVVNANGVIFVSDESGAAVRVDSDTGEQTLLSSGGQLVRPSGVALDPQGALLVADAAALVAGAGASKVVRVDAALGTQEVICPELDLGLSGRLSITSDAAGRVIVVDEGSPAIADGAALRIDPQTCAYEILSQDGDFFDPWGVVVDGAGQILIADRGGSILKLDPETGSQGHYCAGLEGLPTGLALDSNGSLVSVGADGGPLLRSCGERVSDFGELVSPSGVAVIPLPEPHALLQLGVGLAFLVALGRSRRAR
jgi:streptogramin lyase